MNFLNLWKSKNSKENIAGSSDGLLKQETPKELPEIPVIALKCLVKNEEANKFAPIKLPKLNILKQEGIKIEAPKAEMVNKVIEESAMFDAIMDSKNESFFFSKINSLLETKEDLPNIPTVNEMIEALNRESLKNLTEIRKKNILLKISGELLNLKEMEEKRHKIIVHLDSVKQVLKTINSAIIENYSAVYNVFKKESQSIAEDSIMNKKIAGDKRFFLENGSALSSISELIDALNSMDETTFRSHVNEFKNDFGSWIANCFNELELAARIKQLHSKRGIIAELEKSILI